MFSDIKYRVCDESLCKLDQIRYLDDNDYLRPSANPHYVEHMLPGVWQS